MPRDLTPGEAGRRLRIAFYTHNLAGGGAERALLALCEALSERHEITLLLHQSGGELSGQLPPLVEQISFDTKRTLADIPHLVRFLRHRRPDVLVSVLDHNNIAALLARAVARAGVPLVICQQRALDVDGLDGTAWKYRIVPYVYRLLRRHADAAVACSSGVAAELAARGRIPRTRIHVAYNPILDDSFPQRLTAPPPHEWLQHGGPPVFVTAGRLVRQKDQATLLHALAHPAAPAGARLIVLGVGPLHDSLAALAAKLGVAERVCFAGFQLDPLPWMRHADAFVLTSRLEGFGNVLVEALGCGTPVVSTNCPFGPAEILAHGRYGRLVPVGDAAALARTLADDLRSAFPRALLQDRAATFSRAACAATYESLMVRLCPSESLA